MKTKLFILGMLVTMLFIAGCDESLTFKGVSPKTGNIIGGDSLEIKGTGFSNNMGVSIYVGTNKVDNVSIQGSTKILFNTPPALSEGPVDIRIILDNSGEYLIKNEFSYIKETQGGAMDIRNLGSRKNRRKRE